MSEEVYFIKSKGKLLFYSDNILETEKTDKKKNKKKRVKNE